MADAPNHTPAPAPWAIRKPTALIALADGTIVEGEGFGAVGEAAGEVCFNTAMTGYQEILTDPSYAGQIVAFTFPHVGNVGVNSEDVETANRAQKPAARGVIQRAPVTAPSNWRSAGDFGAWLAARGMVGIAGVDTRALTILIRAKGMQNAVIAHSPDGNFDRAALLAKARALPSMDGADLVPGVTTLQRYGWGEGEWRLGKGHPKAAQGTRRVVALDFGVKSNILRLLTDAGCDVTVAPGDTGADDVLALRPDGVFLSNGPGDPAATGRYAVPTIRKLLEAGVPTFGICLGHQMLALAIGARTVKMRQGHHGANHPVKDVETGKVEIVSMNHGFAVDSASLPKGVRETHVSLFDGSNCGLAIEGKPAFSVQHHPEASPGPRDSHYLFRRFTAMMDGAKRA